MIREIRLILWFFCGMMLSAWPVFSYAETIPATQSVAPANRQMYQDTNYRNWLVKATACDKSLAQNGGAYGAGNGWSIGSITEDATYIYCFPTGGINLPYAGWSYSLNKTLSCVPDGALYSDSCAPLVCPTGQNWTLSGSNCTRPDCVSPQVRNASTGLCTAPPCALAANDQIGSGRYATAYPAVSGSYCVNGCTAYAAGSGTIQGTTRYQNMYVNGAGGAASSCTAGGSTPSASPADPTTNLPLTDSAVQKCIDSGQGFGSVNGVTVCSGPTTTTDTKTKTSTNTPAAGEGSPTTTNTTNNTTCTGSGSCTTTTTTTTISGGSGPGGTGAGSVTKVSETKKEETKAGFCEENPDSTICADLCEKQPDLLQCKTLGEPGTEPAIQNQNKGVGSITPFASGAGSCPATVALPRGAEFSYAPMCNFASGVRPIVLAIAWLLAGGMIFAWFRS